MVGTIVMVGSGNYTYTLYVDGAQASQSTSQASALTSGTGQFTIGYQYGQGGAYCMNGDLADIAFYDKALTAAQILAHYQAR